MDNFKVIYKILKYLEAAMDSAEPDYTPIQAEPLGLTQERWTALFKMLMQNGYIEGVEISNYLRRGNTIKTFEPEITLKGIEYLNENTMMKKAQNAIKGIKDIIPFV